MKEESNKEFKQQILDGLYKELKQIKIAFRFLHIFIQGSQKIQYIMPPNAKLLQIKKKLDQQTKKNFIFYLRESFIPSLDSKIGDIALCYGRKENDSRYELTLTASENPYQYG